MSYSHMSIDELLDLADNYLPRAAFVAKQNLAEIEQELNYRQPEIKFRDLEDGFEPYVPDEDETWAWFFDIDGVPVVNGQWRLNDTR